MPTASGRGLLKASGQRAASIALIRMFISWRCTLFAVRAGDLRWPAALSGCGAGKVGSGGSGAAGGLAFLGLALLAGSGAGGAGAGAGAPRLASAARIAGEAVKVMRSVILLSPHAALSRPGCDPVPRARIHPVWRRAVRSDLHATLLHGYANPLKRLNT